MNKIATNLEERGIASVNKQMLNAQFLDLA